MTRTAHRIGLAAVVVALTAAAGAGTTAAYAQSGTGAVTSSISLSFSGGTRISVGDQASLFGFLSLSDSSSANGLTVHVTRTNPDHTEAVVGDVTTTSDQGGFSFVDSPPARGNYTYTATFAGDAQRGGSTGTSDVLTVDGVVTALGLNASTAKSGYRQPVTLTAHLAKHGTNDVVSIYKRPAGGTRTLVRSAPVDADGKRRGHRQASSEHDVRRRLRRRRRVQRGRQLAGHRGGAGADRRQPLAVLRDERRLPPLPLQLELRHARHPLPAVHGVCSSRPRRRTCPAQARVPLRIGMGRRRTAGGQAERAQHDADRRAVCQPGDHRAAVPPCRPSSGATPPTPATRRPGRTSGSPPRPARAYTLAARRACRPPASYAAGSMASSRTRLAQRWRPCASRWATSSAPASAPWMGRAARRSAISRMSVSVTPWTSAW